MNSALTLDRQSPLPLYHQLAEQLRERILDGDLEPHERLPSENELSEQFGISPMTVRQAMTNLVNDGLVYREQGRGTFVAAAPLTNLAHPLTRLMSFTEDMQARDLTPNSRIVRYETSPAPQAVATALECDVGAEVLRVERVRLAEGQPVGVHDTYLPADIPVTRDALEGSGSLYRLFAQHGIELVEGEEVFKAVAADGDLSRHLDVPEGAPLLQVRRTSFDDAGRPVEYVIATYRAELYDYTIRLKR